MLFDRPEFNLQAYLARTRTPRDYDLGAAIARWIEDGVVVFENAIPDDEIDAFLADVEAICESPACYDFELEIRGRRLASSDVDFDPRSEPGVKLNCLEAISKAARQLSLNRFVCDFLGHVFQEPPVTLQSLTFFRGSQQPAHTDYPYVRTQTKLSCLAASWVPLEDVHADAGPLIYYPGSHRPDVVRPFDWGGGSVVLEPDSERSASELAPHLHDQLQRSGIAPHVFLPKRGDILVWHGWLVHEGQKMRDPTRTRRSYVTHYTGYSAYPPNHKKRHARWRGDFTRRHGGFVFDRPWVDETRLAPSWR